MTVVDLFKRCVLALLAIVFCFSFFGCQKDVENEPITIVHNEQEIIGLYTGSLTDGVPHGQGSFIASDSDRLFHYTGNWENGVLAGEGTLKDNQFVAHFPDVDRTGEFEGTVLNGIPNGEGSFRAINSDGEGYTYEGAWLNGAWSGQGVRTWDDDYFTESGTFTNSEFTPTKLEYISSQGSKSDFHFTPTDAAKQFILEHDDLFPAADKAALDGFVDETITYKQLYKSPANFGDKLVYFSDCNVLQIFESEIWGYTVSKILASTDYYDDYVYVHYLGPLPDVYEGSVIDIYALPIDGSSFPNIGGGTTLCHVLFGSIVE